MIEDDRDSSSGKLLLDRRHYGKTHKHLNMPGTSADLPKRLLQALSGKRGIILPGSSEVNANPANPAAMHAVEFCRRSLLVDDSNAASPWTKLLDCIECAGVVSSINARLNDDHAIDMQCAMHVAQLVDRGGLRRVGASWSKRKALRIAKDVHVAIARAWRNFEVHRRSGLRSAGKGIGCRSKQRCCSSSGSGDEKVTSSGHRFEFYCDLGTVEEHEPSEPAQAS